MKKSLLSVSALIIVFSILFTACGKEQILITDIGGETHVAVTDKDGNIVNNQYGEYFEVITDENGETKTQAAVFPEVVTDKANSYAENAVLRMDLPHGWKNFGITSKMKITHTGECTKKGSSNCEITFSYDFQLLKDDLYQNYLREIQTIINSDTGKKLNVYDKEVLGHTAKTVYYELPDDIKCYCFFIQNGSVSVQIEAYVLDCCYTEDQLIAMLNANCTLKDYGDTELTATTTTTTAAAENTSAESAN